ncbi:MAG: hypothetical protein GXP54_07950 [Deltaproteobacteria bacterium]|nr:hypothetical protein [Deltaproteobacteria bacterium]
MKTFVSVVFSAILMMAVGCGSDSGGSDNGIVTDTSSTNTTFQGILVDFKSKAPKAGVDLEVLNNETGEPYDPVKFPPFKSGPEGAINLDLPPGILVGFKASGQDESGYMQFKDSYQFNVKSDDKGKKIYAVNELTYFAALSTAFIEEGDPATYGHLAGTLYWRNAQGEEEFVGCAIIQVTDENGKVLKEKKNADDKATFCGIRYFDTITDMPISLAVADMTHSNNSRYMVADMPIGQYTVTAMLKDDPSTVLGSVTLRAYPGALSIGNIYVDEFLPDLTANPTPVDPKCVGPKEH